MQRPRPAIISFAMARLSSLFALASLVLGMPSKRKRTSGGSVASITPATHTAHVLTETENTVAVSGCATQCLSSSIDATLRDIETTITSARLLRSSTRRTRILTKVDTFPFSNSTHNADFSSPSGSISAPQQTPTDNGCASRPLLASKKDRVLPGVSTTLKSSSKHSYGTRTGLRFDRDDDAGNAKDFFDYSPLFEIGDDQEFNALINEMEELNDFVPTASLDMTEENMVALLGDIDWSDTPALVDPVKLTPEYRVCVPVRIHTNDGFDIAYDGTQTRWILLYDWKSKIIARVEQLAPGIVPCTIRRERLCGHVYTHAGSNAAWSVNVQQWLSAVVDLLQVEREAALAVHALLHALADMCSRLYALGYGLDSLFDVAKDVAIDSLTGQMSLLRPELIVKWTLSCVTPAELLKHLCTILQALSVRGSLMVQTVLHLSFNDTELEMHPLGKNILVADVAAATVSRAKLSHPALTCDAYAALLPDPTSYDALKLDYGGIVLVLEFTAKAEDVGKTIKKHIVEAKRSAEIDVSMRFVCVLVHPTGDMFRVGVIFGIADAFIPLSAVTEDLSSRAAELVLGVSRSLALVRILGGGVGGYISPSTLLFRKTSSYERLMCVPWVYSSITAADRPMADPSIPLPLQTWLCDQLLGKPIERVLPSADFVALAAVYVHMRCLPLNLYSVCDSDGGEQLRPVRAGVDVPYVNAAAILSRNGNLALAVPECTAFTEADALILNILRTIRLAESVKSLIIAQISLSPEFMSFPLCLNRIGTLHVPVERVFSIDRGSHIVFAGRNAWRATNKLTGESVVVIPTNDGEPRDLIELYTSNGTTQNDNHLEDLPVFAVNVGAVISKRYLYTKLIPNVPRLCLPRAIFLHHSAKAAMVWTVYDPEPFVQLSSIVPLSLSDLERAAVQLSETLAKLADFKAYLTSIEIEDIYAIAADGTHDVYLASLSRLQICDSPTMAQALSAVSLEVFLVNLAVQSNVSLSPELGKRFNDIISESLGHVRLHQPVS